MIENAINNPYVATRSGFAPRIIVTSRTSLTSLCDLNPKPSVLR